MTDWQLPSALLLVTLLGVLTLRQRSSRLKLTAELVLAVALGVLLAVRGTSPIPRSADLMPGASGVLSRGMAVAWWVVAARVAASMSTLVLGHDGKSRRARLFSNLLAASIYLAAALVVLNSVLGLPVGGALATSGVVAIVIGLALQNTLSDVFSGIAVGIEQPFHVGDRISLKDLAEGVIVDINWRSIRIHTDGDDIATIPNSIVAKAQIVNRSVPTAQRLTAVELTTNSSTQSARIIDLLHQAVLLSPAILEDPLPTVSLQRLGLRTSSYKVEYHVAGTALMTMARTQLLRQIQRQMHHAGVNENRQLPIVELLKGVALFDALSSDQIEGIAGKLSMRHLEAGEILFAEGERGDALYIVGSGVIGIRRTDVDQQVTVGAIGPGEYIGEISLVTGDPRPVTAAALSRSEVHALSGEALTALVGQVPALGPALEQSMRRGMDLLDRDVAARTLHPTTGGLPILERIRTFFARLPRIPGEGGSGG